MKAVRDDGLSSFKSLWPFMSKSSLIDLVTMTQRKPPFVAIHTYNRSMDTMSSKLPFSKVVIWLSNNCLKNKKKEKRLDPGPVEGELE